MKMKAIIRKASANDMETVHKLIIELAEFEKMADQVMIEASTLKQDGFSENPVFECFVAELAEGQICGFAIYYYCYSTWTGKSVFLEDLYVQEAYRSQGIGKKLFVAVAKVAQQTSNRMDFHVLSWNPAINFYEKLGAVDLTGCEKWHLFRLDGNEISKLLEC